ncbi:hypothetical protein SYNPS1DRAFT_29997 [Syncephalis pseudoplumigaleata]|uniref:HotDog domain-containing protein n=1 Tax=Syncephalis pseudoplumigaleata TaxID=1712513 RepID=A0A4P9YW08_9FUNG|nr:hypothetical protein SYNPS1DRAFT_29997 [Syncephalis pseudoplumigaleata]|eukprot:RKP24236.1 hypothetical protein SYNPS1DRAFT_29997 [Syncephalis pseudoplumigaleata]
MASLASDIQTSPMPAVVEPPRLRPLPAYTHRYSRTINFSDLNVADHLDAAVLCRYIADATAVFWMDVLELPLGYKKSITEWVAHVSGYETQGVQHVVMANLEQRLRYAGEGFRLEQVHIDVTIRSVTNSSCILALHLFVERPRPDNDQLVKRCTLAVAEITTVMLHPVLHRTLPFTPEMRACMAKGMPSSGRNTRLNGMLQSRL